MKHTEERENDKRIFRLETSEYTECTPVQLNATQWQASQGYFI